MNKLVVDEKTKLQQEIEGSDFTDVKPEFQAQSQRVDDALAALSAKTDKNVRAKIAALADKSKDAGHDVAGKSYESSNTAAELDSLFKETEKMQLENNKVEMDKRDKSFIRNGVTPMVQKLKRMQKDSDKPL